MDRVVPELSKCASMALRVQQGPTVTPFLALELNGGHTRAPAECSAQGAAGAVETAAGTRRTAQMSPASREAANEAAAGEPAEAAAGESSEGSTSLERLVLEACSLGIALAKAGKHILPSPTRAMRDTGSPLCKKGAQGNPWRCEASRRRRSSTGRRCQQRTGCPLASAGTQIPPQSPKLRHQQKHLQYLQHRRRHLPGHERVFEAKCHMRLPKQV